MTTGGAARRTSGGWGSRNSFAEDGTRRSGVRSWAPAPSGAAAMTMRAAVASHLEGKDMLNCEDMGEDMGQSRFQRGQIEAHGRCKGSAQPRKVSARPQRL